MSRAGTGTAVRLFARAAGVLSASCHELSRRVDRFVARVVDASPHWGASGDLTDRATAAGVEAFAREAWQDASLEYWERQLAALNENRDSGEL